MGGSSPRELGPETLIPAFRPPRLWEQVSTPLLSGLRAGDPGHEHPSTRSALDTVVHDGSSILTNSRGAAAQTESRHSALPGGTSSLPVGGEQRDGSHRGHPVSPFPENANGHRQDLVRDRNAGLLEQECSRASLGPVIGHKSRSLPLRLTAAEGLSNRETAELCGTAGGRRAAGLRPPQRRVVSRPRAQTCASSPSCVTLRRLLTLSVPHLLGDSGM